MNNEYPIEKYKQRHIVFLYVIHVFSKTIRVTAWNTLLLRKKHGNFFDIFQRDFLKILKMASIAFSNLICLVCSQFSIYRFGSGTKWKIILSSFRWYWYLSTSKTRDIPPFVRAGHIYIVGTPSCSTAVSNMRWETRKIASNQSRCSPQILYTQP